MIERVEGDIFEAEAEAIVNPVNTVGVMGKGLALQFKKRYPENFERYATACASGELAIGRVLAVPTGRSPGVAWIVNFPTKRHWRSRAKIEDIREGLPALVDFVRTAHVTSIAVPRLGAGLGRLEWDEVEPLVIEAFAALVEVRVMLCRPAETAETG